MLALSLLAAACGSESTATDAADGNGAGVTTTQLSPGIDLDADIPASLAVVEADGFDYSSVDYDAEPIGSALRGNRRDEAFPPALVNLDLVRGGGPPPDGIPAIENPVFESASEVDFIADDNEAVLVLDVNGDVRAYPIQIMIWHEIVNDEIGGVPVSVTYCPLCNSALAYDRRLGGRILDFGTSGELYQSAMVMYDRQTESLWSHFTGQGIAGHYAGARLTLLPVQTVSFAQFKAAHPEGLVLTTDTGHRRRYGENPYEGYDAEGSGPFGAFFSGETDGRLQAKARILGIDDEAGPLAVRFETLQASGVVPITEGGRNLVAFFTSGLGSALDDGSVSGRDVGQSGLFVPANADKAPLTFRATDAGTFTDDQTGSEWNILGTAIAGELAGTQLEPVTHVDTFWFAWATYRPETVIL